ncbi:MAG TPA: multicopper oxidase family protein [Polyangia bacterium]|nr:multicopper oxidase family protein [Polyangia bacterium]
MKRFGACAFALLFSACSGDASGGDAAVPDLADANFDAGTTGDFAGSDLAAADLTGGPDLDNHQALQPTVDAVPLKVDGGVDYYEMHVKPGMKQVVPGAMTPIWGFDGQWPGPTIHATLGRPVTLRVYNDLPVAEDITIHNHGHNVAAAYDGHPSNNTIPQGSFYDYHYDNLQQGGAAPNLVGAGTYFFHDHEQMLTAPHFYKGISAFYLIHPQSGSNEAALNLPSGAYDIPLMIQDRSFNPDNSLNYSVSFVNGFQGDVLVVNGTARPYLDVARRKYRFRLLNASNARRIDVGLSTGSMYQISTDGGLLPTQLNPSRIPLAPAERADIVIDFAQYQIGDVVNLTNDDPFTPLQPEILQFRVTSDQTDTSSLPFALNGAFTPYTATTPVTTRSRSLTFDYDSTGGEWRINGKTYNPTAFEFTGTHVDDVEIWSLTNADPTHPIPHPFHQHLVQFQILDICPVASPSCATPPPGPLSGWKDTVLVQPGTIVRVKMKFYYSGADVATAFASPAPYVFHCHNLEHEDHAMMLQQQIQYP